MDIFRQTLILTHSFTELRNCRKTNVDRNELGIINEHDPNANNSDESEIAGEDTKTLQHGLLAEDGKGNLSSNMQSNVAISITNYESLVFYFHIKELTH